MSCSKCRRAAAASILLAVGASPAAFAGSGPDVTFCELYSLTQWGRVDDVLGLAIATTSWNVGDQSLDWYAEPDNRHPFIASAVYRYDTVNDRFEQIGQSWLKHGFLSTNDTDCGGTCTENDDQKLGPNCTDTYNSNLNGTQFLQGPRFEVDPWTGHWDFEGSEFEDPTFGWSPVDRRLQVNVNDLQTPGALYYADAYYVHRDDIDHMNSAAWKSFTTSPPQLGGTVWTFNMTSPIVLPTTGFALDAWPGAMQTVIAQQVPVVEGVSPDGRCIVAAKAIDLGGGSYRYEYAVLNVDMDRQVGSFMVPINLQINVSNVGFHAVAHHEEEFNTVDPDAIMISNDPWVSSVGPGHIAWSTTDNPLRWGTLYNFWFEADSPPDPAGSMVTLGLFRPGSPGSLNGVSVGPELPICAGDADGNGAVDVNDITYVILRLGDPGPDGDVDGNGTVDVNDITFIVPRLGMCI